MGRRRRRRTRSLGGGCGGWNEGGKGREGIYTCLGLFFYDELGGVCCSGSAYIFSLSATWISGTHLGEAKRQKLPGIGHGQNEQHSIGNIIIGMHENIFASSSGRFAIFISVQAILPS